MFTLLSAEESHTAAHRPSREVLLAVLQLFADTHSFHGFFQQMKLSLIVEVDCVLDWQDGVAQSTVVLAAISCGDGRRLCNDQFSFFQLRNVLPYRVDTHADSFADRPVAGPILIGLAVLSVEQVGVDR